MELEQIRALLAAFDESEAVSLKLHCGDMDIQLKKAAACAPAVPAAPMAPIAPAPVMPAAPVAAPAVPETVSAPAETINAPLVGTFYATSAPGEAPFVQVGSQVKQGDTVCLLEAMKMISEVPAPFDCVIEEVLAKDGELAAFDSPLFRVRRL